jgi:hypothetical protein
MASTPLTKAQRDALRRRFPAMQLREILVWENWLGGNAGRFDSYFYNVRLGEGTDPGSSYEDWARRMWIANSMKRADVFAVKGGRLTIIEVEEAPGLTAFGQIAGYVALWRLYVRNGGPSDTHKNLGVDRFVPAALPLDSDPPVMLVCARISIDAIAVAQHAGVAVEVVNTDFTVLRSPAA